ncbi:MAG: BatA domain-containing protein [Planctomycetaceae bacterium]|nr:BatA domain-containing protein [Planctomycetaceae bacterium]
MYFANPWGLLGLISLPIIAAIHLFQRRFPPLLVAGAHLWGAESRVQTAGRRRDRLPITATLLLELLAGLIFSLALAQPRFGQLDSVSHLVVVLDDSASMSAGPSRDSSLRSAAIARLTERVEQMERDTRVTLVRSGLQPTLLGARAMTWDEAKVALTDWRPHATQHDFQPAWDEAAHIVGTDGRYLFLTDHIPQDTTVLPRGMDVISVGKRLPNLAISTARWTFDSEAGEGQLFLRITNSSGDAVRASLNVLSGEQAILQQTFDVSANGSLPLEVNVPGGLGKLTVTISSPTDGLEIDNTVTLIEPKVRMLTVAVALHEDSVALRLMKRALQSVSDVQLGAAEDADLIIGPAGVLPELTPDQWWFGIGPINESADIRKQAKDLIGPYLIEKQHPLMDGIVLGGVVWGGVQPTDLNLRPLISAGRIPLLGQLAGVTSTAYLMNIDLARSNIGESPDWPILMTNLFELCRDDLPGLRRWNYRQNEVIRFRTDSTMDKAEDRRELQLLVPSGEQRELIRDRNDLVEITRLDETGVYEVRDGEQVVGEFAVNFFDDEESASLASLAPGERQARVTTGTSQLSIDDPYSWLMALAILLLIGAILTDWYVLRPRGFSRS